jgi:ABC-2 type transport system permease protein
MKELRIIKRYKANLIGGFVETLVFILMFGLFATASKFRGFDLDSKGMFIFFLGGLLLVFFSNVALFRPSNTVTNDLYNGTLEYIYSTPSSRYAYFIGTIIAGCIIHMIFFTPLFIFLILYAKIGIVNMMFILLVTMAVLAVLVSFGVMIGMMTVTWKQIGSIVGILNLLFQFITGTFFPVSSLPQIVQWIAYAIPFTWGFDLVRYYSFDGKWDTIFPIYMEWLILIIYAIIYAVITKWMMRKVEVHAKTKGLHLL